MRMVLLILIGSLVGLVLSGPGMATFQGGGPPTHPWTLAEDKAETLVDEAAVPVNITITNDGPSQIQYTVWKQVGSDDPTVYKTGWLNSGQSKMVGVESGRSLDIKESDKDPPSGAQGSWQ